MTARLTLPEKLDTSAVPELIASLQAKQGSDLALDGTDLRQIGALAVQTIIVAANDWQDAGHSMTFENVIADVEKQLTLLGTSSAVVTEGDIR